MNEKGENLSEITGEMSDLDTGNILGSGLNHIEFELFLYDLPAELMPRLYDSLGPVAECIDSEGFRGPLVALSRELIANSLKAVFKRLYFHHLLDREDQDYDRDYGEWIVKFRRELEESGGSRLGALARDDEKYVNFRGVWDGDYFVLSSRNPGAPSDIEWSRIKSISEKARDLKSFGNLFSDSNDYDSRQEGAGLGIPLIVMSLRGLGISPDNYFIEKHEGDTVSGIRLPRSIFNGAHRPDVLVRNFDKSVLAQVWNVFRTLDYAALQFDPEGNILSVSRNFVELLGLERADANKIKTLIPPRFFLEVFQGKQGVKQIKQFKNYRVYIQDVSKEKKTLFNVSGYINEKGQVNTVWQEVVSQDRHLQEGSLTGNLMVQNIVQPYIPAPILNKAREMVRYGQEEIPDEVREATIMFVDLVDYTTASENMDPQTLIEFLNIALSLIVRSIESHTGQVEKFMGDAVMSAFHDPLDAVVAAMEIQNHFIQLNEFRELSDSRPIHVRVGINTGTIIMGNIGTENRRDWTPIGDAVNIASRIEKSAELGHVWISDSTFQKVRTHVEPKSEQMIRVKGKENELRVYSIKSVSFINNQSPFTLTLP